MSQTSLIVVEQQPKHQSQHGSRGQQQQHQNQQQRQHQEIQTRI